MKLKLRLHLHRKAKIHTGLMYHSFTIPINSHLVSAHQDAFQIFWHSLSHSGTYWIIVFLGTVTIIYTRTNWCDTWTQSEHVFRIPRNLTEILYGNLPITFAAWSKAWNDFASSNTASWVRIQLEAWMSVLSCAYSGLVAGLIPHPRRLTSCL
jgi:hypothetical protein